MNKERQKKEKNAVNLEDLKTSNNTLNREDSNFIKQLEINTEIENGNNIFNLLSKLLITL